MSEATESFDELNDRRRQPGASEVFMYTFAAVGALTLAEMDAAHADLPGGAALPPPGAGGLRPHSVTDSAFRAAISALMTPPGDGAETPARSLPAGSGSSALATTDSEASLSAAAPLFSAPDRFGAMPSIATENIGEKGGALLSADRLESPFASIAGSIGDRGDLSALPAFAAAPGGSGDVLQALGAYQTFSPEAVAVSTIAISAFGEASLLAHSIAAAARG